MEYKDFKFTGHKNLEAYCLQAMTYKIMLSGRYEADTYICSPLRGDTKKEVDMNMSAARAYLTYANLEMGFSAIAPHAFLPLILDDNEQEERDCALKIGLLILKKCQRILVCGRIISAGMIGEITNAFILGKEVLVFNRSVYGAIKEMAEQNGYNTEKLIYDKSHSYLSASAKEIIPHDDEEGEGDVM